jgi:hypothetical protein
MIAVIRPGNFWESSCQACGAAEKKEKGRKSSLSKALEERQLELFRAHTGNYCRFFLNV